MIYIGNNTWDTLKKPIYVGDKVISRVYAVNEYGNSRRIYPTYKVPYSCSGLEIDGTIYLAPTCLHLEDAWFYRVTGGYYTTINLGTYPTMELSEVTEDGKTVCNGIYLIGENIEPVCSNVSLSYSYASMKDSSFKLNWAYVTDSGTVTGGDTIEVPMNGEYYSGIVKPIITRYLIAHAWVTEGYEETLPAWICSSGQGTGTFKKLSTISTAATALTEAIQLNTDLFCQDFKIPDGAVKLWVGVSGNYSDPKAAGLSGFETPRRYASTTPGVSGIVSGLSAGCYFGENSSGRPNVRIPTYANGNRPKLYANQYGICGSLVTINESTGAVKIEQDALSNGNEYAFTGVEIYDGDTKVGELIYTVDNVITELTTEDNVLWYKGKYTGT